ncbi:MAG: GNAT family N-acetyltransferase [Chromatiaceae bacterium]|jgi:predicted GNAT family N-acyltransferase|nr:GNAT family N-acetyltransferase [Chromatiaceae bacterium]
MNIRTTTFDESEADIRFLRDLVFGDELEVPRELDWDGADALCIQVIATDDAGNPVGTGRVQSDGRIGRLAVRSHWRGRGIGGMMVEALVASARSRGLQQVYLHAQVSAVPFYEKIGFKRYGALFTEAGIQHVKMTKDT